MVNPSTPEGFSIYGQYTFTTNRSLSDMDKGAKLSPPETISIKSKILMMGGTHDVTPRNPLNR